MNYYDILLAKKLGGGGSVTINPLSVSANGTYSAPIGTAYSPVTVNVSGGGGGADTLQGRVDGTISTYANSSVSVVKQYAFAYCFDLEEVSFPNVEIVQSNAFNNCSKLAKVSLPNVSQIQSNAFFYCRLLSQIYCPDLKSISGTGVFASCNVLETINIPSIQNIPSATFSNCYKLSEVDVTNALFIGPSAFLKCSLLKSIYLSRATGISSTAFQSCSALESVYLMGSSVASLANVNAFQYTPISASGILGHYGSVYVPSSLVASYKAATNWTNYSDRITSYVS